MAYNGWTNYETWNVALWLGNDQYTESLMQDLTQTAWDNAEASRSFTREEQAVLDLSEDIKNFVEDLNPLASEASMFSDLLSGALSEVDWHKIAEHYVSDLDKEEEEETEETES